MRAAAVLLAAMPVAAAAQDVRDGILSALAMNACAVSEDETAALFGAQGFDPEVVRHELGQMVLDETAFLERGRILRVLVPFCPPAEPVPTPAQAFRAAVEERDCAIDEDAARELGVDTTTMRPVIQSWVDAGTAHIDKGTLTLEGCS